MNRSTFHYRSFLVVLLTLAVCLSACAPAAAPASSATPAPSSTPAPTDTPVPTPTPAPTDTPTATSTATPDITATHMAYSTAEAQKQLDKIAPDLKTLGYTTDSGSLVWVADQSISMSVSTYMEEKQEKITEDPIGDFILVTDVKWNSSSGLAGCSLIFRSDEDLENGVRYVFPIMRLQNAPAWDIEYYKYGEWQQTLTLGKVQFSPALNDQPESTNHLALVVKGDQFSPFINGDPLMVVTDNKLESGHIFFETWQESGTTTCTFSNGWLWALNP
jgi:hypothetical protein